MNFNKLDNIVNKQNICSNESITTRSKSVIFNPPLSSVPIVSVEVNKCHSLVCSESIAIIPSNDSRQIENTASIVVADGMVSLRRCSQLQREPLQGEEKGESVR